MSSFSDDWRSLKRTLQGGESVRRGRDTNISNTSWGSIRTRLSSAASGSSRRSTLLLGYQHSPVKPVDHIDRPAASSTKLDPNVLSNLARDHGEHAHHASTSAAHEGNETSTTSAPAALHPLHPRARPPKFLDRKDCASPFPNPLGAHPIGNHITLLQVPNQRPSSGFFKELLFDQDDPATQETPPAVTEDIAQPSLRSPEGLPPLPAKTTNPDTLWAPLGPGSSCYSLSLSVSSNSESVGDNISSSPRTSSDPFGPVRNHPSVSSSQAYPTTVPLAAQYALTMQKATPTTALLIVDMQNFFATMTPSAAPQILKLAGHFVSTSRPIIVTQHGHSEEELSPPFGNQLVRKWGAAGSIAVGSHDWDFQPSIDALVAQHKVPVVAKNTYDAFLGTPLEEMLKRKGVERVVVCGVMTDCCVDTTARSAFNRGFESWLVADASASASSDQHEAGLKAFGFAFGEVLETEEVVRRI